jgi:hypothetical protein
MLGYRVDTVRVPPEIKKAYIAMCEDARVQPSKDGAGAFYGGLLDTCPLTSDSAGGWGIGLNVSWTYGDSDVRGKYPIGDIDNSSGG